MPWNNNNENKFDLNKKGDENLNIFDNEEAIFIDINFDSQYSSSLDFNFELIETSQSYYSPFTGSFSQSNFSSLDIDFNFSENLDINSETTIFNSQATQDIITGETSYTDSLFNSQSSLSFEEI